jgi:DNA polymerase-1
VFIDSWFAKRPGVRGFMDEQYYHLRRYGFVWDLGGRVRLTPEGRSALRKVIDAGLRQAGNMRIQGTAACLMKIAMIRMMEELLPALEALGVDAVPIMSIHDEVIFEAESEQAEMVAGCLEETMNDVLRGVMPEGQEFRVPILSDSKVGERWKK